MSDITVMDFTIGVFGIVCLGQVWHYAMFDMDRMARQAACISSTARPVMSVNSS